ncbi:MAG: hypothetical protein KBG29_18815, partial [Pseudomonadales bacterium]|nr:hypothetical protein [Pseudomonadales bacterium]
IARPAALICVIGPHDQDGAASQRDQLQDCHHETIDFTRVAKRARRDGACAPRHGLQSVR